MAGARTPQQRQQVRAREERAWELRMAGKRSAEIAATLEAEGFPRPNDRSVRKMLARVERRIAARFDDCAAAEKARQLGRLAHIADEAMAAWHASKEDAKRISERRVESEAPDTPLADGRRLPGGKRTRVEQFHELTERHGETAYLRTAMAALGDLRKLLGLDAPNRARVELDARHEHAAAPTASEAALAERLAAMGDEEVRQLAALAEKAAGPDYLGLAERLHDGDGTRN